MLMSIQRILKYTCLMNRMRAFAFFPFVKPRGLQQIAITQHKNCIEIYERKNMEFHLRKRDTIYFFYFKWNKLGACSQFFSFHLSQWKVLVLWAFLMINELKKLLCWTDVMAIWNINMAAWAFKIKDYHFNGIDFKILDFNFQNY